MLQALADGETDPIALAALAHRSLRATPAKLRDALGASTELNPLYRRLLKMALADLEFIEQQIGQLDQEIAGLLGEHQDAARYVAREAIIDLAEDHHLAALQEPQLKLA